MSFSEWKEVKLGEVCSKIGSGATPTGGANAYCDNGISLIRSQNVLDLNFSNNGLVYINETQAKKLNNVTLEEGDVLLNITGDSVARSCIVPKEMLPARVNQHVAIIRGSKNQVYNKYILYYLQNKKTYLLSIAGIGGTRNALTKKMIENLNITFPSLYEQKAIADTLSCLDDKIELNNRINKTLEEMAQAIFKSWFVDFEPFQDGEFEDSDLGRIPKGWRVGKAMDFFDISIGKTPPRKESQWFSTNDNDIKWVSISDMGKCGMYIFNTVEYLTKEAVEQHNVKVVPENTILLSFKLTIGRVVITNYQMATNEAIAHFKTNMENINEFLYFYLSNFNYESLGSTSSIASAVNSKIIKAMPMMMPDAKILYLYHNLISPLMSEIRRNQEENQNLIAIRDSLLPKLMSGEIRVPIQEVQ